MASKTEPPITQPAKENVSSSSINEIIYSPLYLSILAIILVVVYKLLKNRLGKSRQPEVKLPKIRKDMTVEELRLYDGKQPDGRVLVAVNGWIFDVTSEKRFYGPGGTYGAFGGKDATRGLATFSVTCSDTYDDLSDLNSLQMESLAEWEAQFREKYDLVGRLLRPGEEPTNYSDEEPEESETERKDK